MQDVHRSGPFAFQIVRKSGDFGGFFAKKSTVNHKRRSLFRFLQGIAPYVGLNFATFHTLKQLLLPAPDHMYFDFINLGLGCTAGMTAATSTYLFVSFEPRKSQIFMDMSLGEMGGSEVAGFTFRVAPKVASSQI